MASLFYNKRFPDYGDLDNDTKGRPGYSFVILENDGGIGVHMGPVKDDYDGETFYRGFLNVSEAEELRDSLDEAISRAKGKTGPGRPHPNRVTDGTV